jgi:aldose 1-epimerase
LELKYLSKDGKEGFPGNLSVKIIYTLTNENELKIEYIATTDKETVINLTNHTLFNLSGFSDGIAKTINTEILQINASNYTPTDTGSILTGEISQVKGTPFDFTSPIAIGERVNESFQALIYGKGYDQNWILDKKMDELTEAAVVYEPSNGSLMRVITDQLALQFYGGIFSRGTEKGKYGEIYNYRTSFALEAQHYPDSLNHSNFPTTVLNPGETNKHICIYKFDTKK